jgi:hypothetical protein
MTDLTDFVNVMASAEDWLAAGRATRREFPDTSGQFPLPL